MPEPKQTLYQVLGVSRSATPAEIARAYRKLEAEMEKADTPPDPRREFAVRDAFEVLSDEYRRSVYDASLLVPERERDRAARRHLLLGGGLAVLLAVAGYLVLMPSSGKGPEPRSAQEIRHDASMAVGRVHSIDLSGKMSPLGLAVAIQHGVMVTPCEGIVPGAELVVYMGPRSASARLVYADERLGLCRLQVHGGGSWPLELGRAARVGDRIYVPSVDGKGQVTLMAGTLKGVAVQPEAKVYQASMVTLGGAPLLDDLGRVVAVSVGGGRHVPVPDGWIVEAPPPPARSVAAEPEPPSDAAPEEVAGLKRRKVELPEARRKALERSLDTVPDDL